MTSHEITEFLASHKEELAQRFGVVKIGLFGSYARGEADENSDIDLAIEMAAGQKNLHKFLAFKRYLEETFDKTVDVGIESSLKTEARKTIEQEIVVTAYPAYRMGQNDVGWISPQGASTKNADTVDALRLSTLPIKGE